MNPYFITENFMKSKYKSISSENLAPEENYATDVLTFCFSNAGD